MQDRPARVVVVGAGIVGMCCAVQLRRRGFAVTVVERKGPGEETSFGNAGGIAVSECVPLSSPGTMLKAPGWLLDPLGPLAVRWAYVPRLVPWLWRFWRAGRQDRVEAHAAALAALHEPTYDDYEPMLREAGIFDLLHRNGHLHLYESERSFAADAGAWRLRRENGVRFERVGPERIRELEPGLAPIFPVAVHTPGWGHVADPHRVVTSFADLLRRLGGEIRLAEAVGFEAGEAGIRRVGLAEGEALDCDHVVIAAGAWSHRLSHQLGDNVPLESERGYHTTLPDPRVGLNNMISSGDFKFVITPMAMGLRIGGTVEFGGLDAPPDYRRARKLVGIARRYLPGLNDAGGSEWMGHRPSLPDSLPVIGPSPRHRNVHYAFGHGHLGLTQAATTGRIVAQLIAGENPGLDVTPYRVDRF